LADAKMVVTDSVGEAATLRTATHAAVEVAA
jgi:hypothetical protein